MITKVIHLSWINLILRKMLKRILKLALIAGLGVMIILPKVWATNDRSSIRLVNVKAVQSDSLFRQGVAYYNSQRYMLAIEFFNKALAKNSENRFAHDFLARGYWFAGYRQQAMAVWQQYRQKYHQDHYVVNKIHLWQLQQRFSEHEYVSYSPIFSFPKKKNTFQGAMDIALSPSGSIWVLALQSGNIFEFDINGQMVQKINGGLSQFAMPYSMVLGQDKIFISDFKSDVIHIINSDGLAQGQFGATGSNPGQFYGPAGMTVDSYGFLYVADSGNDRVQKFDVNGNYIQSYKASSSTARGMSFPVGVAIAGEKDNQSLFILEKKARAISSLDSYGNALANYTSPLLVEPLTIKKYENSLIIGDAKNGLLSFDLSSKKISKFYQETFSLSKELENHYIASRFDERNFYSIAKDSLGYVYMLDATNEQVEVMAPNYYISNNLDVKINFIDSHLYPVIGIKVQVKTPFGDTINQLKRQNFQIFDENVRMEGINTRSIGHKYEAIKATVLVDNSKEMDSFAQDLDWVMDPILKSMERRDGIKVVHFDDQIRNLASDHDWSVRRNKQALMNWQMGSGKNLGKALYAAINEYVSSLHKRAIIIITAGDVFEDSFSQYSMETVLDFANAHDVPIYVISFQGSKLKQLGKKSLGGHYAAYDVRALTTLWSEIRNRDRNFYLLSYSALDDKLYANRFRGLSVRVDFRNQVGMDLAGYYSPN